MESSSQRRGISIADVIIVLAFAFVGVALYYAFNASSKPYPATVAQHRYAREWCVAQQHGSIASVFITKPDIFGSNGTSPRLSIRCTIGKHGYMLKTVDLASANAVPR